MPTAGNGTTLLLPLSNDARVWPARISGPSSFHAESRCLRTTAVRMKSVETRRTARRSAAFNVTDSGWVATHAFAFVSTGVALGLPVFPTAIAPTTTPVSASAMPPNHARRRRNLGDDSLPATSMSGRRPWRPLVLRVDERDGARLPHVDDPLAVNLVQLHV